MLSLIYLFQDASKPYIGASQQPGSIDVFSLIAGFIAGVVATLVYINFREKKALSESPDELSIASAIPLPQKQKQTVKRCPKCNTAYTDQTLNFCLTDGTTLQLSGDGDEFETVLRNR